jgi:hypothetical protein
LITHQALLWSLTLLLELISDIVDETLSCNLVQVERDLVGVQFFLGGEQFDQCLSTSRVVIVLDPDSCDACPIRVGISVEQAKKEFEKL